MDHDQTNDDLRNYSLNFSTNLEIIAIIKMKRRRMLGEGICWVGQNFDLDMVFADWKKAQKQLQPPKICSGVRVSDMTGVFDARPK